ncbi:hypothetical protein [Vibrio sp. ER1A]|uniref:hypothetical protein n=1 Tax=Vibrio sp. ER1A TaxID=1517681 RepID=UPI000AB45F52|nr:hypothetical protein [Vibrio sp. ER1A]
MMIKITHLLLLSIPFNALAETDDLELKGIPPSRLDSYLKTFQKELNDLWINYDGVNYPLSPIALSDDNTFIMQFKKGLVSIEYNMDQGLDDKTNIMVKETYRTDDLTEDEVVQLISEGWEASQISTRYVDGNYLYEGEVETDNYNLISFKLSFNEAAVVSGTSQFSIDGNKAILTGDLGTQTYLQLQKITRDYPDVNTIVLKAVNGSVNDDINLHTGNLLRNSGLNTEIPEGGFAYSGGVDLFSAGVERKVKTGGILGVHSWCCSQGKTADKLSKDNPAHHDQLIFYKKMLGDPIGSQFYFFTIHAAPFRGIHKMTREELERFGLSKSK